MGLRMRAAVIGLLALSMIGTAGGPLRAAQAVPEPERSVWTGTFRSSVSEIRAVYFVTAWTARYSDAAWLKSYVETPGLPAEVAAEGWTGLDEATKRALTVRLVDTLAVVRPEFSMEIATKRGALRARTLDGMRDTVFLVVFDKAKLDALRKASAEQQDAVQEPARTPPQAAALDRRIGALSAATNPKLPAQAKAPAVADEQVAATALLEQGPAVAPPSWTSVQAVEPIGVLPVIGVAPSGDQLRSVVDATTYKVCGELPGSAPQCSPDIPLGTPWTLDLGGRPVQAALKPELSNPLCGIQTRLASLPCADTGSGSLDTAAGLGVGFEVQRLTLDTVQAHVFGLFEAPGAAKRIQLGFDGRTEGLAMRSKASFVLNSLLTAVDPSTVDFSAALSFDDRPQRGAVTFGLWDLVYGDSRRPDLRDPAGTVAGPAEARNPVVGALAIDPLPASLTAGVRISEKPSPEGTVRQFGVRTKAGAQSVLDASASMWRGASRGDAFVTIERLPTWSTTTVTQQPNGNVKAVYEAASAIDEIAVSGKLTGDVAAPDRFKLAQAVIRGLPSGITIDAALAGSDPTISYTSSQPLSSIHAMYADMPGGLAVDADITSLPPYMEMKLGGGAYRFAARMGPAPTDAPSEIGSISLRYASDGNLPSGLPADDHLIVREANGVLAAALRYSGLRALSVDPRNGELHIVIENSAPRLFRLGVTSSVMNAAAVIDKVPSRIAIDRAGKTFTYSAAQTIASIAASAQVPGGASVAVEVGNAPKTVALTLDLDAAKKITWTADGPVGYVKASASLLFAGSRWDAGVNVTGIPGSWELRLPAGGAVWESAPGTSIGSVSAWVTNHGAVRRPTWGLGGYPNHLFATSANGGALDASFLMRQVSKVSVTTAADGFVAEGAMGGGGVFQASVSADIDASSRILALAHLDPLPTSMTVKQEGAKVTYTGNANPNLFVSAEAGNSGGIAAAATPLIYHGVTATDGVGCAAGVCGAGYKVRVNLYGLPSGAVIDGAANTYTFTNWNPGVNYVLVLADLRNSFGTRAYLNQALPRGQAISMGFGPFARKTQADGTPQIVAKGWVSPALGALTADVQKSGLGAAHLEISNIPGGSASNPSFDVTVNLGEITKQVLVNLSQTINRIYASARASIDAATFDAGVELLSIPTSIDLRIARAQGVTPKQVCDDQGCPRTVNEEYGAPYLLYNANADTLTINAYANASLYSPSVGVKAAAKAGITKLAAGTKAELVGSQLRLTTPGGRRTQSITLEVWARLRLAAGVKGCFEASDDPNDPSDDCNDLYRFQYQASLDLRDLTVEALKLIVNDVGNLTVGLGPTIGILGDVGMFYLTWGKISYDLTVGGKLDFVQKTCESIVPLRCTTWVVLWSVVPQFSKTWTGTLNVAFHYGGDHYADIFRADTPIPCWGHMQDLVLRTYPHYHGAKSTNQFSVGRSTMEGQAAYVTVDPFDAIPDALIPYIGAFTAPFGGGLTPRLECV